MSRDIQLKTLVINGGDPRRSRAFLTLGQVMNFPNQLQAADLDWQALEAEYHYHYRRYGYDLQSGCWFCLIGLQRYGWPGLAQALSLLAGVWASPRGQGCWPGEGDVEMRRYLLEWFNSNIVTRLYTLQKSGEQGELQRVAKAVALLQTEAEKTDARCRHSLKNVHYFLQVRSQPDSGSAIRFPVQEATAVADIDLTANPGPLPGQPVSCKALAWFSAGGAAGMLFTLLGAGFLLWLKAPPLSERLLAPLSAVTHYEERLQQLWRSASHQQLEAEKTALLQKAGTLLQQIADRPERALLLQGHLLAQHLEKTWPDNVVSHRWRQALQEKADTLAAPDSYARTLARLDELDTRLRATEQTKGGYLTVSELKSIAWQLRRELEQGGPPAAQLLANNHAVPPAQIKQALERINALNALYLLGTTAAE